MASYLTKKNPNIHVDVFERLPVPFGLCRYGVAPDHPDVKNVEKQFLELFQSGKVTWIGNVNVGRDISVEAMLRHYAAVVFSTGAEGSRTLHIPGEDLGGVISAKDLVSYYNTVPFPFGTPRFCPFDLDRTTRAVVIGNGNVAMDVVRVLSASYSYFSPTDMNCVAIKELMKNRIRQIDVLGRSPASHSAFGIAEFRELTKFQPDTVKVAVDQFSLEAALADTKAAARATNARAYKRLMELVHQFCVSAAEMTEEAQSLATTATGQPLSSSTGGAVPSTPDEGRGHGGGRKGADRGPCTVRFRYSLKPIRFLPNPYRTNYVGGVLCERTDVPPDAAEGERYCVIPCDVVLKSIGYRADAVSGVPFDESAGVIRNVAGRVEGMPRVYCSGWVKTGPRGVILHSVVDAQETVAAILEDLQNGVLPTDGVDPDAASSAPHESADTQPAVTPVPLATGTPHTGSSTTTMYGKYGLVDYFVTKRLEPVSVAGLQRILHVETERGVDLGKRAEKMDTVRDMLDVALGGELAKKTSDRVRGITPPRAEAMLYLKELLDDETDLAPFAHELAEHMPRRLAAQHPSGPIHPSQL